MEQGIRERDRQRGDAWLTLRLALLYAVFAGIWIVISDRALGWLHVSREMELRLASVKGIVFVVVTASLLFLLALGYARRLRRSEERYTSLFAHAVEGLTVFDVVRNDQGEVTDLELVDANPTQERRTGLTRQTVVGTRMSSSAELDERTRAYFEVVAAAVDDGRPARTELHVRGSDSHELLEVYPVGPGTWALAALDISERVRAEREIVSLNRGLEQRVAARTAQLEATNDELESFAHALSHDLRAPLRAMDGFSEILLEDYGDRLDGTGRAHLDRIRNAAGHMSELMDALLRLSRLNREELHCEQVDLTIMTGEIVAELRARDRSRAVDVVIAPGLVAECDRRLTRIALENLLGNAWKYTARRPEGHIDVGSTTVDHHGVAFFVKDDGAGFDMLYADKLFGAFQRLHTEEEFEGTGIGLATVQRIIHRHGGTVWAEGEVENGATFWFTLEAADAG